MKISLTKRKVLEALENQALIPSATIKKLTRLSESNIRHLLRSLTEQGLLRPRPIINPYIFGFQDHAILFSLTTEASSQKHQSLLTRLIQSSNVSWVGKMGGKYHYGVSVLAKNASEAVQFFDEITKHFGNIICNRDFSLRFASNIYGRHYDLPPTPTPIIRYSEGTNNLALAQNDQMLLTHISRGIHRNKSEVARALKMPKTTFERRLAALEEKGVIAGYVNSLPSTVLGLEQYKVLVRLRGASSVSREALKGYCERDTHITHLIECFGNWDFEIGIEVTRGLETVDITSKLYEILSTDIQELEVLPEFECLKFVNCPWGEGMVSAGAVVGAL